MSERVIGFLGLGNMGSPMAANIAAAGYDVVGYDAAGTKDRKPEGVLGADSVAEVGVTYADGPVSGGVAGARARTISLMFGGPTDVFDAHRVVLGSFAGNVFHVGEEAGHGQAMKLINNFLSATALAATSEAFALGQAYGLGLETMLDVVNVSTGRNSATYDKFPNRVLTGTYDTGFHTRLMAKDVRLFNSVAAEVGTLHEVSDAVGAVWNACEDAMPASDFSEIWKYVSRQ